MTVLLLDTATRLAIQAAVGKARERPILWDELRGLVKPENQGPVLTHETSKEAARKRRKSVCIPIPTAFVACISFEEQPAGIVRHLSVSSEISGRVPTPQAVALLAKEFGFTEFPPSQGRVWMEEFQPGQMAVNVTEVTVPNQEGKA